MLKYKLIRLISVFLVGLPIIINAQNPINYRSPQQEYQIAKELFDKEKYGSAQPYFRYVYEKAPDKRDDLKSNSYFYLGVCAAILNNNDAIYLLKNFVNKYPVHSLVPEANYYIGNCFFFNKQYKKALDVYKELNEHDIKKEDLAEYNFKTGYCYFDSKNFDLAKSYFLKVRNSGGNYQKRAIYYMACIACQEEQYRAALEDFKLLVNDPEFSETIPPYLAQIYFNEKNYSEILKIIPPVLNKVSQKNRIELIRMLALSNYYTKDFKHVIYYFEQEPKAIIDYNDNFALGYSLYQEQNYQKAIPYLSQSTKEKNNISQNSYYILADCYLKTKNYNLASQSFLEASKFDFDEGLKEDALFNYAKLQYETSNSSFNSAIKALENYINIYPNSARSEEATSYLSNIYLSTKNYQAAIQSLERIQSKSPELLRAYQRCCYYRGLELLNSGQTSSAIKVIEKSLAYPLDKNIKLSSMFWKGEALYRNSQFQDSYYELQAFQKQDNVKFEENYPYSFYTLGYAAFKINRYADARSAFSNFVNTKYADANTDMKADAYARIGDCYYMEKNPANAILYYEKSEKTANSNLDYSIYQQAMCYGFIKNYNKKLALLNKLVSSYPNSSYFDDAEFEIGETYHTNNHYDESIAAYKKFIKDNSKSPLKRKAYIKLAQSYINNGDEQKSIEAYKFVLENYPGSQEAKDAVANLETIYLEQGNTTSFFDYVKSKNITVSYSRQDTVTFKSAESKYMRGDCDASIKSLDSYIKQFPNGQFLPLAYFYKAECEYGLNNFTDALIDYEYIIKNYNTDFTETTLKKAATILYSLKKWDKAITYYKNLNEIASYEETKLFAQSGIMYSAYNFNNYSEALVAASYLLSLPNLESETRNEASIIAGRSALELRNYSQSRTYLAPLSQNYLNPYSAESAYLIALSYFKEKNYDQCEKKIIEMLATNYTSGSEYWFASVFILYGDLYVVKNNFFQARHTYQSIIDNYEGDDLKNVAREKINELNVLEGVKP